MPPSPRVDRWFVTDEPHRFGSGWISGTLGAVLGLAALGGTACWLWPDTLTTPQLRAHYPADPTPWLAGVAGLALAFGTLSLLLRRKKTLGAIALGSSFVAATLLLVGERGHVTAATPGIALDVFVLNLLLYPAVFLPIERLWPRLAQPTFRHEWWTDLAWFASSALAVQVTTLLVLAPGDAVAAMVPHAIGTAVAAQPLALQFVAIVLVADIVQYWVHRACHRAPWLWRFHEIHHSAVTMDWLAGSRLHVVDAVLTRGLVYAGIATLGFTPTAIGIYLVFVGAQATFVHANVRWRLGWLEPFLVTPRFHHWHHAEHPPDVNFAVHLPWLDRLFGTHWLPTGAWPERYGLANGATGPRGFWRQLLTARPPSRESRC